MKLIITGATGLVGSELVRQSLRVKDIHSVIAVARQPIKLPEDVDTSKLKSVVIKDYGEYPDSIKAEFAGADACIWTVAVTPIKGMNMDFAEVKRVCQTCTLEGFKAIQEAKPAKPFRFVYFSAEGLPQDPLAKPLLLGEYRLMRAQTEQNVLALAKEHDGVEVCLAHPGIITSSTTWAMKAVQGMLSIPNAIGRPALLYNVSTSQVAAAVLNQAVHGFEKGVLSNNDMVRIGDEALRKTP